MPYDLGVPFLGIYTEKTWFWKAHTPKHALQQHLKQPRHENKQVVPGQISGHRKSDAGINGQFLSNEKMK